MADTQPRIIIAGLSGDSGKTVASLSLIAALRRSGKRVSVFKKGPDYIDAAWLSAIAGTACRNLDTFLVETPDVRLSFIRAAADSDIAIIEGNRGLFDGRDVDGTHSTAGLAKLLQAPVVLVVDATKSTRTLAALIKGCLDFDPELKIVGVILNRIAGERHRKIITDAIIKYCNLPVLGAIPKLGSDRTLIPGRHLGLITPAEYNSFAELQNNLTDIATNYLDVNGILNIAAAAPPLTEAKSHVPSADKPKDIKIGYFSDSIFTFYYPENLAALAEQGAELVPISSISDATLPQIDALYIGGGFPETQAEQLAGNRTLMESVRKAAVLKMPIYAECGGLIYLSRTLSCKTGLFLMSSVFPIDLVMHEKPVGHGYTSLKIDSPNPFYDVNTLIKGHEFHYSGIGEIEQIGDGNIVKTCMAVESGVGLANKRDGLIFNNVLACYTHIHALGMKSWASKFAKKARLFRAGEIRHNGDTAEIIQRRFSIKDAKNPGARWASAEA